MRNIFKSPSDFIFISGPCAVESEIQMRQILNSQTRPTLIRGGVYKMRTKRSSFQGLGDEAISIIQNLKQESPFDFITEITDPRQIEKLLPVVTAFQVGARNMYNYELLKELSRLNKPVILKRGFSATLSEWLGAAEYLADLKEENIILCERGVRSFDTKLRNLLDLGSVIYLKKNHPFKVIVDPSHAMGHSNYILDASYASLAAGADGLMVEVHPNPKQALSDPEQAIDLKITLELTNKLTKLCPLFERELRV